MTSKINIYNPITEKQTKVDPYGRTAKNIYRIYIEDLGSDPATILPENLTYNKGRFVKVTPVEDVKNVRRITYAKVKADVGDDNTFGYFKKLLKSYAGQTIKVVKRYSDFEYEIDFDEETGGNNFIIDNIKQQEEAVVWEIPQKGFSSWWKKHSDFFMINSDKELFGDYNKYLDDPKLQAQLLILTLDKVNKEDFNQYFLDGITHCFFHPIKEWANRCEEESKSKGAQSRYKTIHKKVSKYIEKYPKGIPEEDLSNVCNDLQISVEIDLPSTWWRDNKFIEVESQKKALKKFKFINTRLNHIELNEVSNKDDYTEVDKESINTIFDVLKKQDEFILWKEGRAGITQINTLTNIYKLKNDENSYEEAVKKFNDDYEYCFSNYKIEKNANEELTDFLDNSLNCNGTINFMDATAETELNHIDIKKAYTQGMECSMYKGYLGKISDFRKTDKIVGLGIYKVENINFNGSVIEKMRCFHNNGNYPSPELEFYQSIGITFDIVMGCWGTGFDFEFPDYMYQKEGGVAHYCKFYGCLMKLTEKERYNFSCKNIEFAKLNAYNSPDSIRYNKHENSGIIEYDKKYVYHSYHIASFIASYSRITLLEQILKFKDFNQIAYVVVDGIYFTGNVEVGDLFTKKEKKSPKTFTDSDEFVPKPFGSFIEDYENLGEYRENNKVEVHLGAGGCGKTHNNLTDKGFVNPLFIAPSWKLARNKKTEYGIDSSVFFYALDDDPDKYQKLERNYSVFIVDEISMLSNEAKEKLLKRFSEHKIIFCGDLGYQLPPIKGTEFKVGDLPVFHHTTNYRCQCKELEKRLLFLRNIISKGFDGYSCEKIIEKLKLNIVDKNSIDYKVEDLIICKTRESAYEGKDSYTEKYTDLEKYAVLENTRDYCNGEIIIGPKPKKVKCELRHGFTIHSIQGETAKHKLFIDMNKMRSVRMLYTAMSRAKKLEQIVFVK
jgi:hypothetical protein